CSRLGGSSVTVKSASIVPEFGATTLTLLIDSERSVRGSNGSLNPANRRLGRDRRRGGRADRDHNAPSHRRHRLAVILTPVARPWRQAARDHHIPVRAHPAPAHRRLLVSAASWKWGQEKPGRAGSGQRLRPDNRPHPQKPVLFERGR